MEGVVLAAFRRGYAYLNLIAGGYGYASPGDVHASCGGGGHHTRGEQILGRGPHADTNCVGGRQRFLVCGGQGEEILTNHVRSEGPMDRFVSDGVKGDGFWSAVLSPRVV